MVASSSSGTSASGVVGPLDGVRVLDFTSVVLGPVGTQILGDHGAEIIKIEALAGDSMRANGAARNPGMSSIFLAINRNKRSLAIDLKKPEGLKVVLQLAKSADVIVHNMRVPAMARLGLGYDDIRAFNPSVIYCAATGFGQEGPDALKPAFDDIIQAACGLVSLIGKTGDRPDYTPSLIADKLAGIAVSSAILAALFHRERTGEGQYLEVPMFETLVEFMLTEHLGGLAFDPAAGPAGYARILSDGRRPSRTEDGYIAMLPYSPKHWVDIFAYVGRQDLLAQIDISDRFKVNQSVRTLYERFNEITPLYTTERWIEICGELDIPATKIYAIDELPEHPHLVEVGLFQFMDHPTEGRTRYVRPTVRYSRTPMSVRLPAPTLGQDSLTILHELGYSEADICELQKQCVISGPAPADNADTNSENDPAVPLHT